MEEDGIVDIVVEVMVVEEAADRCWPEDCISVGSACRRSHFVVVGEEGLNEDVAVVSGSSSFSGLHFATTAEIPYMVEVSNDDVGTYHFALEGTLTLQAGEGVGRNWHVGCEEALCAVAASTLLVRRLPHLHLHPRHLLRLFLESPKVLCAHVGYHTATISPIARPGRSTYVGISRQRLSDVSG